MSSRFLAVDVGTTFIKGAVVDVDRLRIDRVERAAFPDRIAGRPEVFHEVDTGEVLRAVRAVIERLAGSWDVAGVLLCGQMGGLVLADERGAAVSPYISWLDRRTTLPGAGGGESVFERFATRIGPDGRRRLGNEVRAPLLPVFLFWLALEGRLPRGAMPVTLLDFLAAALCDDTRPVVEWTSATGTLDVFARDFPRDLYEDLGLNALDWPHLVDFRRPLGAMELRETARGKADRPLPVYPAVGDHQAALLGSLLEPGELSINISTGSQVAMLVDTPERNEAQVRPFFDGAWLATVTNIAAGRALASLVSLFSELGRLGDKAPEDPWSYILAEAEKVATPTLRAELGFFPGAVEEPGSLTSLREDNLRVGHVFAAAFVAMAEYYERFALRLSPHRSWSRIVFSGGLAQKVALLRRRILERLGDAHRIAPCEEDTLLGLAILGRVIRGREPSVATAVESARAIWRDRGGSTPGMEC